MAHRVFVDGQGIRWEVWEVHPTSLERRRGTERRAMPRNGRDRRQRVQTRVSSDPVLAHGWLVFASRVEKRRLAPIPAGWASATDEAISGLLRQATPSGRPRRLIE